MSDWHVASQQLNNPRCLHSVVDLQESPSLIDGRIAVLFLQSCGHAIFVSLPIQRLSPQTSAFSQSCLQLFIVSPNS